MTGVIKGTGCCMPERVLSNDEIAGLVETSDAWIQERTGIKRRHIAVEETCSMLAAEAARRALSNAGIEAAELDLIVVSTMTPSHIMPGTACEVQRSIGAEKAQCFDLNAACSGFLVAWNTVQAYLAAGYAKKALIVGSECLSKVTDWRDRSTCILFGDGAGAVVVEAEEGEAYLPAVHSDGRLGEALTLESPFRGSPFSEGRLQGDSPFLQMEGQAVFKFAVRRVPEVIEEVLEKNGLEKEAISHYILHQANRRILEAVAGRLHEPQEKFPMNLQEYGNTSSASIPILLDELRRSGSLQKGQRIVLAGFGGGLTWGAAVTEWEG